jgi:uncharacterized protein involved in exopolysaccharide biosynthesis
MLLAQIATTEAALKESTDRMQAYQRANSLVNVASESSNLVNRTEELKKTIDQDEATMAEKSAESERIQKQLHIDLTTALNSVASASNNTYTQMQTDLEEMEREYATKSITLAATHPSMLKLKTKMGILQKQLEQQLVLTLGEKTAKSPNVLIKDTIRTGMVSQLATLESQKEALKNKLVINYEQLESLKASLDKSPPSKSNLIGWITSRKTCVSSSTDWNKV